MKMRNEKFNFAGQYPFERDEFTYAFYEVFGKDGVETLLDIIDTSNCVIVDEDFLLQRVCDEFYIFHLKSMTGINWYKHLGRCNTCSRNDLNINDFHDFLKLLHDAMVNDGLIKDKLYFNDNEE